MRDKYSGLDPERIMRCPSRPEADPPIQPPEPSKELLQRIERMEWELKTLKKAVVRLSNALDSDSHC